MPSPFSAFGASLNSATSAVSGIYDTIKGIVQAAQATKGFVVALEQLRRNDTFTNLLTAANAAFRVIDSGIATLKTFTGSIGSVLSSITSLLAGISKVIISTIITIAKVVYTVLKTVTNIVVSTLNGIYHGMSNLIGFAGRMTEAGSKLLTLPWNILESALGTIGTNIAKFVQLSSPGDFQRFDLAVRDLYATIGRALIPVLNVFTGYLRVIGGELLGLNSSGQKTIWAIAAGTVAMVAFTVAMLAFETIISGGILPLISTVVAGIVGAISGLLIVSPQFKAVFDEIGSAISAAFTEIGSLLSSFTEGLDISFLKDIVTIFKSLYSVLEGFFDIGVMIIGVVFKLVAVIFNLLGPLINLAINLAAIFTLIGRLSFILVLLARVLEPVLEVLMYVINGIVTGINYLVNALNSVFPAIFKLSKQAITFGFGPTPSKLADNFGQAVGSASTGDPADVLKKARESAYAIGGGAKPEVATANNTAVTNIKLDNIDKNITTVGDVITGLLSIFVKKDFLPDKKIPGSNRLSKQDIQEEIIRQHHQQLKNVR